ncbi:MAG: PD-(D/E)XK nuclease family transposase [Muribaculaceae bacterium]|nr:PD-(D/E)XK nuclease family transposase [Muribaculaceae bacterium]
MEEIEIKTEYINIQTDFGFKHVFGSLKNKVALIRFLNALFDGTFTVKDVTYHDKEILPSEDGGKRIVYDVYCTVPVSRSESPFFSGTLSGDPDMDNMDSTSLAYREGRFPEIFEASRSSRLRKEEIVAYSQSLEKLRDTQLGIQHAAARARTEGRAEGRAEEKKEIARKMVREGVSSKLIAAFTGLSESEIEAL